MVKIHCLGGFREVGSNAVQIVGSKSLILDFGLKVESNGMPLKPKGKLDGVILSHGHLDHCGMIPYLYKKNNCPYYATKATYEQSVLLLEDSFKIAGINKLKKEFSKNDISIMMHKWKEIKYNKKVKLGPKTSFEIFDAGHIPGSCMPLIKMDGKTILYTGDFKLDETQLVEGAQLNTGKVDVLIMETTYSSREHTPRYQAEKELIKIVKQTIQQGGIALLPSFALRAAEIILILDKYNIDAPIYLDGMARKAIDIFKDNPRYLKNSMALKKAMKKVNNIGPHQDRNEALKNPSVIVTTGGCLEGGPIVHYIKHLYTRKDCSLILTGFQIPKTAGRYLVDTGRFVLDNVDLKLKIPLYQLDFSGHAGRSELLKLIKKVRPKKVICMHGEYCQKFATEVKGRFNIDAVAPKNGDILEV